MSSGGKREGAGRPKGTFAKSTLDALTAKQNLVDLYTKNAEAVHFALIDSAIGGDMTAIKELLDRVHGKSLQTSEVTNKKEYRLSDPILEKYAETLATIQKADVGGNTSST